MQRLEIELVIRFDRNEAHVLAITEEGRKALGKSLETHRRHHWTREMHSIFEASPRAILLACLYSGTEEALECAYQLES